MPSGDGWQANRSYFSFYVVPVSQVGLIMSSCVTKPSLSAHRKMRRRTLVPPLRFGAAIFAAAALFGLPGFAGGYVAPIVEIAAPMNIASAAPVPYWLALIPLGLLVFLGLDRGDGRTVPPPGDWGGPCFCEGTLLHLDRGWVPIEAIRPGDLIRTSKGMQPVLSVESWQPTEFRDRSVVIKGVRVSQNHGVAHGAYRVPAADLSPVRARIDGSRFFHVLVRDHSWLYAKADPEAEVLEAESLMLTADDLVGKRFPDLVPGHMAHPAAPDAPRPEAAA